MADGKKKIRSVPVYLDLLRKAGRSERTIRAYRDNLSSFSRFLGVNLEDLHNHLSFEDLMAYLDSSRMKELKPNSRRIAMASISRYMRLNGVEFDELEMEVVKARPIESREDKPLEYDTAVKMLDLADVHMKAVITFLISTGCRIGETSKLLISDVRGDAVTIRPEIAKGRRGGKVYLNAEAREFLDLWLKERDAWCARADKRALNIGQIRKKDDRLFGCNSNTLSEHFARLYQAVDGETCKIYRGKRGMVTPHSCRAYFRTHAARSMGPDLPEGLMRHTGYLNAAYVRMSEEERCRLFHEGEDELYITRKDRRHSDNQMAISRKRTEELAAEIERLKKRAVFRDDVDELRGSEPHN